MPVRLAFAYSERSEAAEYGDTSAIYWKLYMSEAEENDQKLVESLSGDTNSMLILVRRILKP